MDLEAQLGEGSKDDSAAQPDVAVFPDKGEEKGHENGVEMSVMEITSPVSDSSDSTPTKKKKKKTKTKAKKAQFNLASPDACDPSTSEGASDPQVYLAPVSVLKTPGGHIPDRARTPGSQHLSIGSAFGGTASSVRASDQAYPPQSPSDANAIICSSYLSATSSDGGTPVPVPESFPAEPEPTLPADSPKEKLKEDRLDATDSSMGSTVAQSHHAPTTVHASPVESVEESGSQEQSASLSLNMPMQALENVELIGHTPEHNSPRLSTQGTSVATPSVQALGSKGEGLTVNTQSLRMEASVLPPSPSPFLSNPRTKIEALTWWDHFFKLLHGTPAEEAVDELGRNFELDRQRKVVNTISAVLSVIAVAIVVVNHPLRTMYLDCALSVVTMLHLMSLVKLYYVWYHKECLMKKDYRLLYPSFVASPNFYLFLLHGFAIVLHAPPVIADLHSYVRIINSFVVFRLFECLTAVSHYTLVGTAGSSLVASLAGQRLGTVFVYKMLLFKYPVTTIAVSSLAGYVF